MKHVFLNILIINKDNNHIIMIHNKNYVFKNVIINGIFIINYPMEHMIIDVHKLIIV